MAQLKEASLEEIDNFELLFETNRGFWRPPEQDPVWQLRGGPYRWVLAHRFLPSLGSLF
jgi:hypothetical protein